MVQALFGLLQFFWNAAQEYADTQEGHDQLQSVLGAIEDEGFDIPFWQPEQEAQNVEGEDFQPSASKSRRVVPGEGS